MASNGGGTAAKLASGGNLCPAAVVAADGLTERRGMFIWRRVTAPAHGETLTASVAAAAGSSVAAGGRCNHRERHMRPAKRAETAAYYLFKRTYGG